ncbi:ATP-binding protein [Dyadobacter aurulentus]|uniref:ATP-binding protein n=1 Tax=Dyadobacter sp. UC 10 TaxID=2605428 RepID=UPI0011F2EBF1|nr:tetratricopeptide repeat-containing sensor histidine kinase [Dyadobacter sp. UC 10]KAA0990071.1 sensor histidine kinase [Dyadobacter sp. UC 10]
MRIYIICALLLISATQSACGQIEVIRKLKDRLHQVKDSTQYVDVLNKISLLFYEQNADSTLIYSVRALEIASRLEYEKGIADATNNLGIVYDIKGNSQLAMRYYNDAYNKYRAIGDSSNIVQTLMNIAMVYELSGKDEKAVNNFKQALSLGNRIAHDSITALAIYNYMLIYPDHFKEKERERYIEKARAIALKYKDMRMQLAIEQLLAEDFISNQEHAKGIGLLQKTLAKSLQMQLYFFSMDLMIRLGDLHLAAAPDTAMKYYGEALMIAEQKLYRVYAREICTKLYEYFRSKGDMAKAYTYTQKLVKLFEEQAEIDRVSGIDYIEYAVKDQQLKSAQLKSVYNSRLLWLAVAVCVLTILSIVFLFRNWVLTRKTNEVLQLQFRQLESTSEALEESNQNYARLIKVIAHDLRNPIGAIKGLSSMLLEEKLTAEENNEFTTLIRQASESCIKLISDLLETDFNLKESKLVKEEINLAAFLQQTVKLLSFRANEKSQELILKEPGNAVVMADRDKLLRALNNLIVNAIKFSPIGGKIEIAGSQSSEGFLISVKDYGLGIPENQASRIFDPFTSSKRPGTAGEQPFGLGLYITKQIIEAHHGRIWFESEDGKGTTFFVMLPISF